MLNAKVPERYVVCAHCAHANTDKPGCKLGDTLCFDFGHFEWNSDPNVDRHYRKGIRSGLDAFACGCCGNNGCRVPEDVANIGSCHGGTGYYKWRPMAPEYDAGHAIGFKRRVNELPPTACGAQSACDTAAPPAGKLPKIVRLAEVQKKINACERQLIEYKSQFDAILME